MMRRTAAWNHLMKGVIIALAIVSSAVGEEAPDAFDSQAAKGPDPRKELRAEAALPGVDPDVARSVARPNMTLLADPGRSPIGNTVAIPPGSEQVLIGSMRKELDDTKAELAKTKLLIGEVMQEYKRSSATPDLPPLPDAEVRVFQLKNTSADSAADKIKLLIGTQPVRIAIDEASNGLIVFGKAEALPQVEQLVVKLDDLAVKGGGGFSAPPTSVFAPKEQTAARRTLMLRVFWLANDVPGLDVPTEYLPPAVINSLAKLGFDIPQLVTQTVTSISVDEGGASVPFSTDVPAVLLDQSARMTLSGSISATPDNRTSVEIKLAITEMMAGMAGSMINMPKLCELNGSLAAPIGHFMVLGTANSVIAGHSAGKAGSGGMGMQMGRGMEGPDATGMGRGIPMDGGGEMGMEMPAPADRFNSTRFAFVVQVVEAESFAPEE